MADDEPLFELDFRPALPAPPPTMIIRRNDGRMPLVMGEEEALELYLLLKGHFEGKATDAG